MKKLYTTIFFLTSAISFSWAQFQADSVCALQNILKESSGLEFLNGKIITHNDSGNDPMLYEIDTITGLPSRSVFVSNAQNIDWEDITADFTHIYIGDFGNNQGTRQNLRILKISQTDYLASDTVTAEIINFSYANQTNFSPQPFQTNFDAEALVTQNDSLFVFTKQWGAPGGCRVYGMPKMPGTYALPVHDSLSFPGGIVTAADMIHDALVDALVLLINDAQPRLHARYNLIGTKFSQGTNSENTLILPGSLQAEGLVTLGRNLYYFSSEEFLGDPGVLSVLRKNPLFEIDELPTALSVEIFPNPSENEAKVRAPKNALLTIFDPAGKKIEVIKIEAQQSKNVKLPTAGTYIFSFQFENGATVRKKVVRK